MKTHFWRYLENERNYPGYNFSTDADGCRAVLRWLRTFEERPVFRLQPVTADVLSVPNNRDGAAGYFGFTSFLLRTLPDAPPGHFAFTEVSGHLTLECSQVQVDLLIEGVEGLQRGEGDHRIGASREQALWFWGYPGE